MKQITVETAFVFDLQDVVVKGDAYFNTGDLLLWDTDYYVYFVDRIGDTFRYVILYKAWSAL